MKVLMIAPQPWFSPRGTPFSVLHRLYAISRLGHQVDLVTYHIGKDIPIKNVTIYRIPKIPFIKKIAVGPSLTKVLLDIFIFIKARKLLKQNKYDLLHTHEEAGFIAPIFIGKFKLRHLYDMHSSLPQQLTNFKFTKLRFLIRLFEQLENSTITSAEAVITICPELHAYVKALFPDKFNMLIENVADNSVVFRQKTKSPDDIKKQYNLNNHLVVVYAGTFESYQGLDLLIKSGLRVINYHRNVAFILVGGNPEQVEKYKELAEEQKISEYFIFTGSVQPEQVQSYESIADILVSPRIAGNNTPLKIYSYLRSGKPIVATRHVTHTQVLNEEVSILTDCTPEAFSDGIIRVIDDKSLREQITTKAKQLADTKYSYRIYLEKTKRIYEYLMEKSV